MSPVTEGLNLFNRPNYFELSSTLKMAFSGDRFSVEEHFNVLYVTYLRLLNNIRKRQSNVDYIDHISYLSLHTSASLLSSAGGFILSRSNIFS